MQNGEADRTQNVRWSSVICVGIRRQDRQDHLLVVLPCWERTGVASGLKPGSKIISCHWRSKEWKRTYEVLGVLSFLSSMRCHRKLFFGRFDHLYKTNQHHSTKNRMHRSTCFHTSSYYLQLRISRAQSPWFWQGSWDYLRNPNLFEKDQCSCLAPALPPRCSDTPG